MNIAVAVWVESSMWFSPKLFDPVAPETACLWKSTRAACFTPAPNIQEPSNTRAGCFPNWYEDIYRDGKTTNTHGQTLSIYQSLMVLCCVFPNLVEYAKPFVLEDIYDLNYVQAFLVAADVFYAPWKGNMEGPVVCFASCQTCNYSVTAKPWPDDAIHDAILSN